VKFKKKLAKKYINIQRGRGRGGGVETSKTITFDGKIEFHSIILFS
jgi:hypothetical protein